MRKILFFDIDGTIMTDAAEGGEKIIPESTARAIKKARENGHLCFINSGRPYVNIDKDVLKIGFDGVISGCGTNVRVGDRVILGETVPKDVCRLIADLCRKCRMNGFFEKSDMNYFIQAGPEEGWIYDFIKDVEDNGAKVLYDVESESFGFDKMCAFGNENSDIEGFLKKAGEFFSVIDRGNSFYELVPKGFSKGSAMKIAADYFNVKKEDTYAFGDSENDIDMFNATPNSVGMGNGKRIHPFVSFVTKDILDDGIEYALKHFNII